MHKVVFLRHGQSLWNKENRFTGWTDVGLTEKGVEEAETGARQLMAGARGVPRQRLTVTPR